MTQSFTLGVQGPFSLASSIRFLEGFTPAALDPAHRADQLDLAFCADPDWTPVAVTVSQEGDTVHGVFAPDPADRSAVDRAAVDRVAVDRVAGHVARILSLDADGSAFPPVGQRDPVVAGLQAAYPGLRPVCFWSPYEAACWAVIGHRIRIRQAASVKAEMTRQLGHPIELGGRTLTAFPAPDRLATLESFPGLSGRKPEWIRGIARAALDGRLDPDMLRAIPRHQALAGLKELGGIGDFSAELILLRGAGEPDHAPGHEPRFLRAVQLAYGLAAPPSPERIAAITAQWAPYRTWVTLLVRTNLEDTTHEIAGPASAPRS